MGVVDGTRRGLKAADEVGLCLKRGVAEHDNDTFKVHSRVEDVSVTFV